MLRSILFKVLKIVLPVLILGAILLSSYSFFFTKMALNLTEEDQTYYYSSKSTFFDALGIGEYEKSEREKRIEAVKKAEEKSENVNKDKAKGNKIRYPEIDGKTQFSKEELEKISKDPKVQKIIEGVISAGLDRVGKAKYSQGHTERRDWPNCFDCSSFAAYCYFTQGIQIDHRNKYPNTSSIKSSMISRKCSVPLADKQPGDLLWRPGHITVYIGNGKVVHASNRRSGIKVSNANYSRWSYCFRPTLLLK